MKFFDSHLHIIDPRFPLIPNNGYLPPTFTSSDYLSRLEGHELVGGAVVSGSFQGFDQSYLIEALSDLGENFFGVTQVPATIEDSEILRLDRCGVRAIRFNLKRGGSEDIKHLDYLARRVYDIAGWHSELYVDSAELDRIAGILSSLPAVSIDHLGLASAGFKTLLQLVEQGVRVKATGFGRVDFDVKNALRSIYAANPEAMMFGTDLPSTRAPREFNWSDLELVVETLGEEGTAKVCLENALKFYRARSFNITDTSCA